MCLVGASGPVDDDSGSETSVESQDYDRVAFDLDDLDLGSQINRVEYTPDAPPGPDSGVFSMDEINTNGIATSDYVLPDQVCRAYLNQSVNDREEIRDEAEPENYEYAHDVFARARLLITRAQETDMRKNLNDSSPFQETFAEEYNSSLSKISNIGDATEKAMPPADVFTSITCDKVTQYLSTTDTPTWSRSTKECFSTIKVEQSHTVLSPTDQHTDSNQCWMSYFAFTCLATFVASATEASPLWYIITIFIFSVISFHILDQDNCTYKNK